MTDQSPSKKSWQRLMRNRPAVFGLCLIAIASLLAIFAYWLAPDPTPDANDQVAEIALSDPGFSIQMLKVRKNQELQEAGLFESLLFGKPSPYKSIPINNYQFVEDSIQVEKYMGINSETRTLYEGAPLQYHLADVAFPINFGKNKIIREGDHISYEDITGIQYKSSISELQLLIKTEHLISRKYWLGADRFGRSVLSRLILGVRISLLVGLIAVVISLTIGILMGAIAGYFGGQVDDIIMLLINTVWSIPTLLLVFAIVLALGRGIGIIFLAVGLTMWVDVARIVRGQVMAMKEEQFVEAAKSMGFTTYRIITKHILPNILGPVMVIAAANFATAILIEAGLSYLGFGIRPPTPSWGTMLNENYGYAIGGKPFLAIIPALAIMLMVLAFNLIGNGLRDALDVKMKT